MALWAERGNFYQQTAVEMPKKCQPETAQARRESDTSTQTHISYHAYLWQRREGMREGDERGGYRKQVRKKGKKASVALVTETCRVC